MTVKMSVNLSDQAARTMKQLADENGLTITEEVRRAISTSLWLKEVQKAAGKILVAYPNSQIREVVFPWHE